MAGAQLYQELLPVGSVAQRMTFQGATYEPRHDKERLTRQLDRVRVTMLRGEWWTLQHLYMRCGGSLPGISARIRDLRKAPWHYVIERRRKGDPKDGVFEYRLLPPVVGAQQELRL